MKNNDDIHTTDTTEIRQLINRVKQGELDPGDAQLIEKLLNFLITIVSLLPLKHASIRRMKGLLFGMKEKKLGKDEANNRAEESRSGAEESSQTDSPNEAASNSTCECDSSTQEVRRLKRPGHGRKRCLHLEPPLKIVRHRRRISQRRISRTTAHRKDTEHLPCRECLLLKFRHKRFRGVHKLYPFVDVNRSLPLPSSSSPASKHSFGGPA